jgi:DNA-binding MarR family transcriptional regulator
MSRPAGAETFGLGEEEAAALGADGATRIRTFRLVVVLAQELRTLMDQLLRPDGLTTQQAALITIVEVMGRPSLSTAAASLGTTHQNAKQLASALERKGFIRFVPDGQDGRIRRLITTPKSRSYWRERSGSDQRRVLEWFSELTEEEAQTLFQLLLRLKASVHGAVARREETD